MWRVPFCCLYIPIKWRNKCWYPVLGYIMTSLINEMNIGLAYLKAQTSVLKPCWKPPFPDLFFPFHRKDDRPRNSGKIRLGSRMLLRRPQIMERSIFLHLGNRSGPTPPPQKSFDRLLVLPGLQRVAFCWPICAFPPLPNICAAWRSFPGCWSVPSWKRCANGAYSRFGFHRRLESGTRRSFLRRRTRIRWCSMAFWKQLIIPKKNKGKGPGSEGQTVSRFSFPKKKWLRFPDLLPRNGVSCGHPQIDRPIDFARPIMDITDPRIWGASDWGKLETRISETFTY